MDGYPYDYHRLLYTFRVKSRAKDVGIYRPRHAWRFTGDVQLQEAAAVTASISTPRPSSVRRATRDAGPAHRLHQRRLRHPASRPRALPPGARGARRLS